MRPILVIDSEYRWQDGCARLDYEGKERTPHPPNAVIESIAYVFFDKKDDRYVIKIGTLKADTEEARVGLFLARYADRVPRLVTFGGRGADMPLIFARAMRYGIRALAFHDRIVAGKRYDTADHLDLHDALGSFGAQRYGGLDDWARCIGWPGKGDTDGSKVAEMLKEPDGRAKVDAYCLCDAVQTAAVFLRFEMANGELDRDTYTTLAAELLNVAAADQRTKSVADAVDIDVFLPKPTEKAA